MSNRIWLGTASSVAQEDRFTPGGTIEVGDKFILTLTGEDGSTGVVTAVATGTTVAQVCADLLTAWNASTSTLKTGITASNQTTYFKLLGTAGTPFYCAATTTESDDSPADAQTFVRTATTANSGSADWGTASNWSGAAVPIAGDDVYFRNSSVAVSYGLNQSAVTLGSLTIDMTYTGTLGTADAYQRISATAVRIGDPSAEPGTPATGSGRIKLNFGSVQTAVVVVNTNTTSSTDSGLEPVRLLGTHASNAVSALGGRVGLGTTTPGEANTWLTVSVTGSSTTVNIGSGATLTTLNVGGGTLTSGSAFTTLNQTGGNFYSMGTGAITTVNIDSGTSYLNSTGTITTLNIGNDGTASFEQDPRSRTVTNCSLYEGGTLKADNGRPLSITFTNGVDLQRCSLEDVTLDFGSNVTVTASTI